MSWDVHRCAEVMLLLALCIIGSAGCSKHIEIQQLPSEIREHMKFADYLCYEKKGENEYILAFDSNRDSKADTWEMWIVLSNKTTLHMAWADKDFDGVVDRWLHFNPTNDVFLEFDTDGDGKPDRRVLRSGRRLAFNGTSWREVTSTVCNGSE